VLRSLGFSSWFRSYLTCRQSRMRLVGNFSPPFTVTSDVPQGFVLGPFLFNVFVSDLSNSIQRCKFLFFADLKIFRVITSPRDCLLLQSDVDSVRDWCAANSMRLNSHKTQLIMYSRKTYVCVMIIGSVVLALHVPLLLRALALSLTPNCIFTTM
jgi:hypothetical protein